MAEARSYRAYLLRGWLEEAGYAATVWRFRLQDVQTGDQWGFTSLEAVTAFLEQEFAQDDDQAPA